MPSREQTPGLIEDLHRGVLERLAAQEWRAVERETSEPPAIGKFVLPLGDGFSATAVFPFLRNDESGELIVVGRVGVDYEPAREFLDAFVGSQISGVLLNEPSLTATISGAKKVSNTAERLAGFILTKAVGLARRNADIDALVKLQRDGLAVPFKGLAGGIYAYQAMGPGRKLTLEGVEAELIPALLATAGRHDEARQALADYISHGGEKIDTREYHRFARQLTRYLDAGGDLPLPSTPARWPVRHAMARARPNIGEAFREARRGVHAKKEALDAVRAGLKGLKDVAVAGAEITKIFREDWEPPTDPDWLKAPERAAYPVSGVTARWAAVELDPAARSWLDRIAQNNKEHPLTFREVEIWLTLGPGQSNGNTCLQAHIGTERVGMLNPDATDQFLPVMEAAAERDEDPHTRGRLNEISDEMPYLLEIALPTPPPDGNA